VSPVIITVAAEEEHLKNEQKNRVYMTSFICTEDRCLRRCGAVEAEEKHSADEQKNRTRGDVPPKN
jgi:hypothetical protein